MAAPLLRICGNSGFLALYLGGGLASSALCYWWYHIVKHYPPWAACGASGSVCAMLSYVACVAPTSQALIFGVIPMPVWLAAGGLFAWDIYMTLTDKGITQGSGSPGHIVASPGHVGGFLYGAGFALGKIFRVF
ncbi:hypothetical protein EW026_g4391 [Hermanssonia centrifuga]|uniref:Peptidase S54 rhomboid domain-containing protein n=1 Tax=Hermanssonia centrifuga TaxID=98765 RepID=A0A4S4KHA6_9APHY|nr:hypothetical protein EW026_g4391 [Hermanssonia centrifuga]